MSMDSISFAICIVVLEAGLAGIPLRLDDFGQRRLRGGVGLARVTCITCRRIWTGGVASDGADSMLYSRDGVVAVGSRDGISKHPDFPSSKKIDLGEGVVIPGLSDSHVHLLAYAKQNLFVDLSAARSIDDALASLRARARDLGPDEWVCGFKLNETSWEKSVMPNSEDFDAMEIPNPVLVQRICTHATVLNRRAMVMCGLDSGEWGEGVQRDASGAPTGIILEDVQEVAHSRMGLDMFKRKNLLDLLKQAIDECSSYGLSAVFVCGAMSLGMEERIDLYQELRARGDLKIRVFSYHDSDTVPSMTTGFGDRRISYQGHKLFMDGSLGARTAALSSPYSDAPGETGMLLHGRDELVRLIKRLDSINCQVLAHAIGDAALDGFLDAVSEARGDMPRAGGELPPVVNHCMICRPEQIERMKRLGVSATIQPTFLQSDRDMAPLRLGDRIDMGWAYPWRGLLDAGICVNGASDCPIESLNPWDGVRAAVDRMTASGVWMPDQRLSVEEALRIYTVNPAVNSGTISWRGTLEEGKEADFVLLDRDIFNGPDGLRDARVLCTVVGGEEVYGELGGMNPNPKAEP
jgi:predicted amidohydrolase YtcJ